MKENEPPSAPLLHVHIFPLRTVCLLQLCRPPAVTVMSSWTRTLCSCHIELHPGCRGSRQGGTLHHPERVACPRSMSAQRQTLFCWLLPLLPPPQRLLLLLRLESWTICFLHKDSLHAFASQFALLLPQVSDGSEMCVLFYFLWTFSSSAFVVFVVSSPLWHSIGAG